MLASIQRITGKRKNTNSDHLYVYNVLGWQVVDRDIYEVGDLVVYIQIDTVLPEADWCEFMRERGFRVRSVKFRKELSQGMIFPLSILPTEMGIDAHFYCTDEGIIAFDGELLARPVSKTLGVTKYEKPLPKNTDAMGVFPSHIVPITDEERIQNMPEILGTFEEADITLKHDGTSFTYIRNCIYDGVEQDLVCSRRQVLKRPDSYDDSHYWSVYKKYALERLPKDIVIQGELCGPGIQGNKEELKQYKLYVFNVFSQTDGWLSQEEIRDLCYDYELDTVTKIDERPEWNLQSLLDFADEQKYKSGRQAEGIVVRPNAPIGNVRPQSFKVISNKFLLKNKE